MKGGGEWWRFLIEKPGELPSQATLFWKSWWRGHGAFTLASIGNWIQQYGTNPKRMMVPLGKIILWHPVRGQSERASAGAKTTARANSMKEYFQSKKGDQRIELSEAVFATIPNMGSSDAISTIKVTPLIADIRRYVRDKIKSVPAYSRGTRSVIKKLKNQVNSRKETSTKKTPSFLKEFKKGNKPYPSSEPFYLVSSGQGRLQAVKEAATELGMDFDTIFVETEVYDVPRNLCSLFIVLGNEYREEGSFQDPRHSTDNVIMPAAETCKKDGSATEDMLSLYREVSYDNVGRKYFNTEAKSLSNYNSENNVLVQSTDHDGGKRRTRKKRS
jgi:hypothetical protein